MAGSGPDALSPLLRHFELKGAVLGRAHFASPFAVHKGEHRDAQGRTGLFHAVVEGGGWLCIGATAEPMRVRAGDIAILPRGAAHTLSCSGARAGQPLATIPWRIDGAAALMEGGGGETPTLKLVCGLFELPSSSLHPLFDGLPELFVVRRPDGSRGGFIDASLRYLVDELSRIDPGGEAISGRIVEVLLLETLRRGLQDTADPVAVGGWLAGLRDELVAKALAIVHRSPVPPPVDHLAASVGVSRTVLFERFRDVVGESPAQYALKWRMHVAGTALTKEGLSVAEAADRAGYDSEAAFARAFKRVIGTSPGAFRDQTANDRA